MDDSIKMFFKQKSLLADFNINNLDVSADKNLLKINSLSEVDEEQISKIESSISIEFNFSYKDKIATNNNIKDYFVKGINGFTGKDKFEEAKKRLKDLSEKKRRGEESFNAFLAYINNNVNSIVKKINEHRRTLVTYDFKHFIKITSVFAKWEIFGEKVFHEYSPLHQSSFNINTEQNELFSIDFESNPVEAYLKAFSSFGFWSRREANDSLEKVEYQEKILSEELEKQKSEKMRLRKVKESLLQVSEYFEDLRKCYYELLRELEYSVDLVKSAYYIQNPTYFDSKIDIYFLPKRFQLCLMASDKLTRILFYLAKRKYLDDNLITSITDLEKSKNDYNSTKKIKQLLVA